MSRFPLVLLVPLTCFAQQPHEREVQRAIIELNERSAAFARGEPPRPLAPHVGQPLHADPEVARQLRPYERMRVAGEGPFVLQLPPPAVQQKKSGSDPDLKPLPLPGRPQSVVDPVELPRARD
jgi:hypothetical protein